MPTRKAPARLMSITEVADYTNVSRRTVNRAIACGKLRASRFMGQVRIDPADLNAALDHINY